jgi:peptide/nickel transport system substrate-binding protein
MFTTARDARGGPRVLGRFVCLVSLACAGLLSTTLACQLGSTRRPSGPIRLSIGYANPRLYDSSSFGIGGLLSLLDDERLVYADRDGRFKAALAERWERSADGLTWSIFLRPNLTFQSGAPADASAVAALLNNLISRPTRRPGLRDVERVEARGPLQVLIQLRRPSSFVLDALADATIRTPGKDSSGTGPFRVVHRDQGRATLEAFSGYYRGRPSIDQIEVQPYDNARNAWSAMMRGQIDMLYEVTPDAIDFIEGSSATQLRSFLRAYLYTLGFNLKHPVLRRRDVRVALSQAVNREDIIKGPLGGKGEAAASGFWPLHWAYDPDAPPKFQYAPAEARRLLDAAGLSVKAAGEHQMPSRFRFTCLLPDDPRFERMGLVLQRQLSEIGIDMQLESRPKAAVVQRLRGGQYEAYLTEIISRDLEWVYMFWHTPEPGSEAMFDFGYHAADAALDRLREARSDDETRAAVRAVQQAMYDEPPAVFLGWGRTARAVSGRFELPPASERDILSSVAQWRPLVDGESAPVPATERSRAGSP